MLTMEQIIKFRKEELIDISEDLKEDDIKQLVEWLSSKDDKLRYPTYLILQYRSDSHDSLYTYWDTFVNMLSNDNSYIKIIGAGLISRNVKWDKENRIMKTLDKYLELCEDEKLVTARMCIQNLHYIINGSNFDKDICDKIVNKLIYINISKRPNTNWKVMTTDIVNILMQIQKEVSYKEIINYLGKCLESNIIDKKLKKEVEELVN